MTGARIRQKGTRACKIDVKEVYRLIIIGYLF